MQVRDLIKSLQKHNLNNVTFLTYQRTEVLPYSFSSADFGVVSLSKEANGLSIPSKTFYLLSAGLAVISISSDDSEISQLISKNSCGFNVNPGSVDELVFKITNMKSYDIEECKVNSRKLSHDFTDTNVTKFLEI